MLGLEIDKPRQLELNRRFGLDLPLWRQFTRFVIADFNPDGSFFCGVICGNLGPSIQQGGRNVQDVFFAPSEDCHSGKAVLDDAPIITFKPDIIP